MRARYSEPNHSARVGPISDSSSQTCHSRVAEKTRPPTIRNTTSDTAPMTWASGMFMPLRMEGSTFTRSVTGALWRTASTSAAAWERVRVLMA